MINAYQQFGCGGLVIHVWKRLMSLCSVHTRRNHSQKLRRIGYNHIDPYGQSFFPNCISAWNGLAKDIAEANTYHCTNKTDGRSTLTLTGITGTTHTLYGRRLFMVSSIELHLHHKTAPS